MHVLASPALDCIPELLEQVFPLLLVLSLEERRDCQMAQKSGTGDCFLGFFEKRNQLVSRAVASRFSDKTVQFARFGQLRSNLVCAEFP